MTGREGVEGAAGHAEGNPIMEPKCGRPLRTCLSSLIKLFIHSHDIA